MVSGFEISSFIQRVSSLFAWCILCVFFSLFVSTGSFMPAAFILVVLFIVIALILGPHFVAVFWLAGSPTLFGFPNEFLRSLPFVTMERLLLLLLMVMVFLQYAFSKRKTQWLPVEITIVVFLIYAMASMAVHTDIAMVRQDGWLWFQFFMPMASFIVSRRIDWSDRGLRIVLTAFTFTGVFVAIIGLLQSRFGIDIFTMNYQTLASGHTGRAYGTFSNAHTFVATSFIFLTITLLQYNIHKDAFLRCILIFAMAVISIGIVLGVSRGPWIGAALAFLIIFIKHPRARPLMLIGGLSTLFVGMSLFFLWVDYLDGLISRVTNISTLHGRAAVWATAVNMIADNPFFGLGFGSEVFTLNKAEYITGIGSLSAQYAVYLGVPHNQYLHVAVMLGIPGLILFMIILTGMVRLMFQVFKQRDKGELRRHLALYTGAIFIALMFNSFFSDTYIQDYFWLLTFFLAGIAAGSNLDGLAVSSEDKPVRESYEAKVNG